MDTTNDNEKSPKSSKQILKNNENDNIDEILSDDSENSICDSYEEEDSDEDYDPCLLYTSDAADE